MEIFTRKIRSQFSTTYNFPVIRIDYPTGRFTFSKILADELGIREGQGVVFGFEEGKAYLTLSNSSDSFILRNKKGEGSFRFTCKDLAIKFDELFKPGKSKSLILEVDPNCNCDFFHEIKPIE